MQRSTKDRETVKIRRKERRKTKMWKKDKTECVAPESADITVNHQDEHKNENLLQRTAPKVSEMGEK